MEKMHELLDLKPFDLRDDVDYTIEMLMDLL